MAFRQPTFAPPRQTSHHQQEPLSPAPPPVLQQRPITESREWLLFPVRSRSSVQTYTASTARTPGTAGLSRLSDFGSLETAARIGLDAPDDPALEEDVVDDDEELDSLDDGLYAFQESSLYPDGPHYNQSESVFPRHDGLGMFPSSPRVQEQLWHFEQYNPRKRAVSGHHRRRSSVQRRLDAVEDNDEATIERDRMERIEKWRLDHSRILLDEVEKQTRRRLSRASQSQQASTQEKDDVKVGSVAGLTHSEGSVSEGIATTEEESFWQRVTRKVFRDFIGIDEAILSIIFGEALPSQTTKPTGGLSSSKSAPNLSLASRGDFGWEKRLLDRVARELGVLVQQLSDHPGAFATPSISPPTEYAGIPISPLPRTSSTSSIHPDRPTTILPSINPTVTSPQTPNFTPTLLHQQRPPLPTSTTSASAASDTHHAALWGIEEEEASPSSNPQTQTQNELDYWERPPTLKTIFRLLSTRFTSSRPTPHPKPPNIATTSTPESLRRAAIIRQHHPLVSRAHARARARRSMALYSSAVSHSYASGEKRRGDSSCASDAKRRRGSGSSRNYWDLGGGSAVGSGSFGVGVWGEV